MAKTRAVDDNALAVRRPGMVWRTFLWAGRVLRVLLASLVVSIAIEWVGMHLWWPELGTEHSRQMVQAESRFLSENISISWVQGKPAEAFYRLMSKTSSLLTQSRIAEYLAEWSRSLARHLNSSSAWRGIRRFGSPYTLSARNISQLYAIRLMVLCLSAPLFALLVLVALVDGLVQRDRRRWGGGRESSYVYHYAKRSNFMFVAFGAVVYLAMPFSVHPAIVLVPFASACALTVSLTASRFKKYL